MTLQCARAFRKYIVYGPRESGDIVIVRIFILIIIIRPARHTWRKGLLKLQRSARSALRCDVTVFTGRREAAHRGSTETKRAQQ